MEGRFCSSNPGVKSCCETVERNVRDVGMVRFITLLAAQMKDVPV